MTRHGFETQLKMYVQSLSGKSQWDWPVSIDDWRAQAREKLADGPWGYVEGGAGAEQTMRNNRAAFDRWQIRPRMLRNVDDRDLTIELFGKTYPTPFLLAPIGVQSIIHPDAESASAKAAAAQRIPFITSTVSSVDLETLARETEGAERWFQLYPGRDPDVVSSFIRRAETVGYAAIVVTVDTTMLGWRERDLSNLYLPFLFGEGIANFLTDPAFCARLQQPPADNQFAAVQEFLSIYVNPAFTWDDLAKIRRQTKLPLLVKGLTHVEDVQLAMRLGADGVVLSNHGGRQVDGAVASLDALVDVRREIGPDYPVLLDSGIRHAADVFKAMALGANAVLIGRPYAYALAVGGQAGVQELLGQWTAELDLQLALSGYNSIRDIDASCVKRLQ
ncbi:alpha-hydroxy-acid oxidizing protein [Alicyclobacillus cycloheptanicus]|uniref:L-lactate oxidase n=1 Tax=Alicyclobacillus cycloheptanicus TaxID=1457 RepID=A0ABT9XEU5_9BACL|nr:alpha-hydroxy-acid oxidizing protein [Alicyclobacillus cycloheptanicus]MDQ0188717.1 lactate 2-monooxygenase [Alicyclobacillus cycloheptanicus]WDM00616.1 alpha-hydroxy-acid oxidizing protein [Alicyclobacillus cycloheptanicus]